VSHVEVSDRQWLAAMREGPMLAAMSGQYTVWSSKPQHATRSRTVGSWASTHLLWRAIAGNYGARSHAA